nr:Ig-like domain-containing protein [Actinomycetota bacterium]
MRNRGLVRAGGVLVAGMLLVGIVAGTAAAQKVRPATSKMKFKLDSHTVVVGDQVTGTVHLWTRSNHHWVPLADSDLSVRLDGTEVATATTDSDGKASISLTSDTAGDHVIKVVYAGDDTHRKAQRAQGFE